MPTKEEILHSHPIVANNNGSDLYISLESARRAMDEYAAQYAKQQAVEFMKYVDAFYSQQVSSTEYDKMYSQFIEQQTKE